MASTQVVETSVAKDSPSQDSSHPVDHFQSRYVTPDLKPFSYLLVLFSLSFPYFYSPQAGSTPASVPRRARSQAAISISKPFIAIPT